eukprot:TRINITY_DN23141_c0_g1_i3.p1 TRINITY_DN23141_c0_g1~~TRINITY_DN23141_c0_g1_i3.p1  ORF type:complete len:619 (-),score=95.04 TRINITY_DN23141_c0_g1_i3:309-2165(-)
MHLDMFKDISPETLSIWVVLGLNALNLLVYASLQVYRARRACPTLDQLWLVSAAKWNLWVDGVKHYFGAVDKLDAFERKVRELAAEARVQRGRTTSRIGSHIGAALSIFMVLGFQYYNLRIWFDVDRARWELHQSNFLQLTVCSAVSTLCSMYPAKMTACTFHLWHALIFCRLCWQVTTTDSLYQLFALEQTQGGLRFFSALGLGTPAVTLALNMTCSWSKVWMYHTHYVSLAAAEREFVFCFWGDIRTFFIHEIFLCATAWAVSTILDVWNYSSVRSGLRAKASSTSEQTVKSMLVVLCDAVVTVDERLEFDNAGTEIAQFLLRQPLNNSYQGMSFLDLVEEADRERVRQQITSTLIGHGTTLSVSARLVDGNGSLLTVQMYCTCFIDIDDCRAYIIGILELKDPTSNVRQDTISLENVNDSIKGARGSGTLHTSVEWDRDSFKSVMSVESALVPLVGEEDELEIWIDLAAETIPIVDVSRLVRTMTGPESCIGVSFLDWLKHAEAAEVVQRISDGFSEFMKNPQEAVPLADLGEFHLRPPHAVRAGLEYVTKMRMDMTRLRENGTADGPMCVCLRPDDIAVQKLARQKRSAKPPGPSSVSSGSSASSAGLRRLRHA